MKTFRKFTAVLLCVVMCMFFAVSASAQGGTVISDPYDGIDWSSVNQYKTALHTHTNASDGKMTLRQSLERHAETGYDIVATTDHGTVNYSWGEENVNSLIYGALSLVKRTEGSLDYLGESGSFENGLTYTYSTEENGDDYLRLSDGNDILRLPYGIENNAVSVNAHVNSWFTDHCDNSVTTYDDAISAIDELGGVCVINHPGEYTKARYELHSQDAYNTDNFAYAYYVNKFASLIENYDGCIGIDMNSKGDSRTRFDRILWDALLERFAANGENVYAIASSDAHQLDKIDTGCTILLMDEKTSEAAEKALRDGTFFAASTCIGNYDELIDIAAALREYYGETELYGEITAVTNNMAEKVAQIESGKLDASEDIGYTFSFLDSEGYNTSDSRPVISSVAVDNDNGTITLDTEDALLVRWISDGKLICTTRADDASFSVYDYADSLGDYVRAEVFGEGGIVYTQAFLLNQAENAGTSDVIKGTFFDGGIFDFLFAVLKNWSDIISRFFTNIFC